VTRVAADNLISAIENLKPEPKHVALNFKTEAVRKCSFLLCGGGNLAPSRVCVNHYFQREPSTAGIYKAQIKKSAAAVTAAALANARVSSFIMTFPLR
jgi:hypothetical protein